MKRESPSPPASASLAASPCNSKKQRLNDLAIFGGSPVVPTIRSASNLVQPNPTLFFERLELTYEQDCWVNGPNCQELERRLAAVHDVEHCITFCNGLWAIVVTLDTVKLPGRQQVVMPSMTYRRLGDIAAWAELTPHFCDVSAATLAATPETIAPCINSSTAALLIAHPIVNVCDVEAIESLALERGAPVVFDAVEAAFATCKGRVLGSFGNAECYSLHASKFLNGFEGGYVTTNDSRLAEQLRSRRSGEPLSNRRGHGAAFAGPMHEAHAAMAIASLADAPAQIQRNRQRHHRYLAGLAEVPGIRLVRYAEEEQRTFKNTLVELLPSWPFTREQTIAILHAENLLVRAYYSPPLHKKTTSYSTLSSSLPVTESVSEDYLLLPSGEFLSHEEIGAICELLAFLQKHGAAVATRLEDGNGKSSRLDSVNPLRVKRPTANVEADVTSWRSEPEDTVGPWLNWIDLKRSFGGMFARRYYTNHGPLVQQLEETLAEYCRCGHAIAVTNEMVGLVIAMRTLWPQEEFDNRVAVSSADYSLFCHAANWASVNICPVGAAQANGEPWWSRFESQLGSLFRGGDHQLGGLACRAEEESRTCRLLSLAHEHGVPSLLFRSTSIAGIRSLGTATVARLAHEPHAAAAVLVNDDELAARIRNMRSSYGAGKPARIPVTGNARMSEAQAGLALLAMSEPAT